MAAIPETEDWVTLTFLPGLGCTLINRLVYYAGSPGALLRARKASLAAIPGMGERLLGILHNEKMLSEARRRAEQVLRGLTADGIVLLTPDDSRYPQILHPLPDRPVTLYCRGDLSCLDCPALSIVGARAATDYGRRMSARFARELAAAGMAIVSGAACGIDAAAHLGALEAGGMTLAVLGCGVDVVYPRSHAGLFKQILAHGLLLSEYPPATPPEGFRFPARNRIISGLARGVLVVEAAGQSGSLITARLALEQGKEVFAVPGRIDSPKSAGTHRLIQDGALLVQGVGDILEALSWTSAAPSCPPVDENPARSGPSGPEEKRIWDCLEIYPRDIDAIIQASGLAAADVHALLLRMELKGLVRQLPGQCYERRAAEKE